MEPKKPMGDVDDLIFQDAWRSVNDKGLPLSGSPFAVRVCHAKA